MFTISTNRVKDKVCFSEGDEKLILYVDVDPFMFVYDMQDTIADMKKLNDNSEPDEIMNAAKSLGIRMFGESQMEKLIEFYHGNEHQIFSVTTRYFVDRLKGLINEKQKKMTKKGFFRR